MKTGLTLEQLAAEITRQQNAKEDYVVNTGNLRLESYGHDLALHVLDNDGSDRIERWRSAILPTGRSVRT